MFATIRYMSSGPRGIARELYDLVQETRALKGWTAVRLHKESGVSRSTIDKWRTQQRPPLAGKVIAVADALGIERRRALELGHVLPPDSEPVISTELLAAIRRELDTEDQERVIEFITALLSGSGG